MGGINAPTIMEHVESFKDHSSNEVYNLNSVNGRPILGYKNDFDAVILHYSAFMSLDNKLVEFINSIEAPKIAFYQDENHNWGRRNKAIEDLDISIVYTLLDKNYHNFYRKNNRVKNVFFTLTGYVHKNLIEVSKKILQNQQEREIDFGYRARPLPYYMGEGAQEKVDIANGFLSRISKKNYKTDIKTREEDRIYGNDWHKFIANCKAMIGVEAGVSIFDFDGNAEIETKEYLEKNPDASFSEVRKNILFKYEGNVHYRTISPRVFECAAFKTCMILFEGNYNGILLPNIHYIPLKKDYSNIEEVLNKYEDLEFRERIINKAYHDLILSKKYSYDAFIQRFDSEIENLILEKSKKKNLSILFSHVFYFDLFLKRVWFRIKNQVKKLYIFLRKQDFPFKEYLKNYLYKINALKKPKVDITDRFI